MHRIKFFIIKCKNIQIQYEARESESQGATIEKCFYGDCTAFIWKQVRVQGLKRVQSLSIFTD